MIWAVVAAAAALTTLGRRRASNLSWLDGIVLMFFGTLGLSVIDGVHTVQDLAHAYWLWLGPYLAGRFLAGRLSPPSFARIVVLAACVLTPALVIEMGSAFNVFLNTFPGARNLTTGLGTQLVRLGHTRIQGSFGEPIPLAIFLSTAAVCSLALAVVAVGFRRRAWFLLVAVALTTLQAAALSRIGWVLLIVALLWMVALQPQRVVWRSRTGVVVGCALALLVVGTAGPTKTLLFGGSSKGAREVAASTAYRSQLLAYAQRPGVLRPFGSRVQFRGPFGVRSVDNEYLLLASSWGFVTTLAFALIGLVAAVYGVKYRASYWAVVFTAIAVGLFVVHSSVALVSQEQMFFWLIIGALAGVVGSEERVRKARSEAAGPYGHR